MILHGGRGSQPRIGVAELGQREAAVGCGVGLLIREVLTLLFLEMIKLVPRADPHRQVKSSQPWFLVAPGPAGFVLVAVSTCPVILFLQVLLEWRWPTPHPWEEQNPPTIQRNLQEQYEQARGHRH